MGKEKWGNVATGQWRNRHHVFNCIDAIPAGVFQRGLQYSKVTVINIALDGTDITVDCSRMVMAYATLCSIFVVFGHRQFKRTNNPFHPILPGTTVHTILE